MSEWLIGIDELAQSRFQASAMIETASALATLADGRPTAGLEQWADTHRPAYQARIADDPFAAALVQAALQPHWTAGIIVLPPHRSDRTFYDELRHVPRAAARTRAPWPVDQRNAAPATAYPRSRHARR